MAKLYLPSKKSLMESVCDDFCLTNGVSKAGIKMWPVVLLSVCILSIRKMNINKSSTCLVCFCDSVTDFFDEQIEY